MDGNAVAQELSRVGIGGSEIAAACGFSRYLTRYGLWLVKTGRARPFAGNVHTRLGLLCEPRARRLYADACGHDIVIPPRSVFHPEVPWARCTPDGYRVNDPGHLVQIKCVGYYVGRRWRYELPVEVLAQCQWEMFVTGGHTNDLAVLVGSDELEWERFLLGDIDDPQEVFDRAMLEVFTIHRSDDDIAVLRRGAEEFLRLVDADEQPPIDGSQEATAFLNRRANKSGVALEHDADPAISAALEQWRVVDAAAKRADRELGVLKNQIREAMGNAGANRINTPDGPVMWIARKDGSAQLRQPPGWAGTEE